MWNGWNDCSAGLGDYSSQNENTELHQQFSSDGTEKIAPYCDLKGKPQAESQHTVSRHCTEALIISSPLIISPICMAKWLGSSKEPFSSSDRLIIRLTLQAIALRCSVLRGLALALLLAFGMLIYKDLHPAMPLENSPRLVPSLGSPCDAYKLPIVAKLPQ